MPIREANKNMPIGHGIAGELAASSIQLEGGFFRRLRVWCLRGAEWVPILSTILQNDSNAKTYIPLCFYTSRLDQMQAYIFFRSPPSSIVRLIPGAFWAPEEELFSTSNRILTVPLPHSTYAYRNKRFDRHRTEEEEAEFQTAKRRHLTQPLSFDHSSI